MRQVPAEVDSGRDRSLVDRRRHSGEVELDRQLRVLVSQPLEGSQEEDVRAGDDVESCGRAAERAAQAGATALLAAELRVEIPGVDDPQGIVVS